MRLTNLCSRLFRYLYRSILTSFTTGLTSCFTFGYRLRRCCLPRLGAGLPFLTALIFLHVSSESGFPLCASLIFFLCSSDKGALFLPLRASLILALASGVCLYPVAAIRIFSIASGVRLTPRVFQQHEQCYTQGESINIMLLTLNKNLGKPTCSTIAKRKASAP